MPQRSRLRPLALALLLSASTVAGAQGNNSYVQGLEDSIAAYTVSDFASHGPKPDGFRQVNLRSEEHTSELQSLMRNSYAVFCLKKKKKTINITTKATAYT